MPDIATIAQELVDPRGRCNRKGLVILAVAILALEAVIGLIVLALGISLEGPLAISIKLAFFWTAFAAASKRLHDLGRSAWWVAAGLLGLIVWSFALAIAALMAFGPHVLTTSTAVYAAIMIGTMLPALAALLWLHFAKGHPGPNKFGPQPEGLGFSRPTEADMISAMPSAA